MRTLRGVHKACSRSEYRAQIGYVDRIRQNNERINERICAQYVHFLKRARNGKEATLVNC